VHSLKETTWRIVPTSKEQVTMRGKWHSAESLVITNIDPKTEHGVGHLQLIKIVAEGVHKILNALDFICSCNIKVTHQAQILPVQHMIPML
jgi:hypothetical protein